MAQKTEENVGQDDWKGNDEEQAYLDLVRTILLRESYDDNRTGIKTASVHGATLRFDLSEGFPLLTCRKLFLRGIFEELMWMLRGQTDSKILEAKGVTIWKGNTTKQFHQDRAKKLRRIGAFRAADKVEAYEEGDAGPVYGFQWRHFGTYYSGCRRDYTGIGFDQIARVVQQIRQEPWSRDILLTAFNPEARDECVLAPCHLVCRFSVKDGKLRCNLWQRSCDMGLGVPFNIASYSLLTMLLALHCDLEPGEFLWQGSDVHVYENHEAALKEVVSRRPYPFPTLRIRERRDRIEDYVWTDLELVDYRCHAPVKMEMAV
jgi:thymidylate synthase